MRARDRSKSKDQRDEGGARGDGVREQGHSHVTARETLRHDARANNCGDEESRPKEFGRDSPVETWPHWCPMRSICFWIASVSRLDSGKQRNNPILRSRIMKASRKAFSTASLEPFTAAGSGTPQCAVMGWPGHTGQISLAALSHTVKTKSSFGAPGFANSSQSLLRKPFMGRRATAS